MLCTLIFAHLDYTCSTTLNYNGELIVNLWLIAQTYVMKMEGSFYALAVIAVNKICIWHKGDKNTRHKLFCKSHCSSACFSHVQSSSHPSVTLCFSSSLASHLMSFINSFTSSPHSPPCFLCRWSRTGPPCRAGRWPSKPHRPPRPPRR